MRIEQAGICQDKKSIDGNIMLGQKRQIPDSAAGRRCAHSSREFPDKEAWKPWKKDTYRTLKERPGSCGHETVFKGKSAGNQRSSCSIGGHFDSICREKQRGPDSRIYPYAQGNAIFCRNAIRGLCRVA